jgi:hypothetical protein
MAKQDNWMSQDLGQAPDPQTANGGLLAAAGASRGKAAEIAGQVKAETIDFLGKTGAAAYQGYQYVSAAQDAKEVMSSLNSPTWLGEGANKALESKRKLDAMHPDDPARGDVQWAADIDNAAKQGVLTQPQAQARLAQQMRERIAANPGAAATIRKAFEDYSGRSNWDVMDMQNAFATDDRAKAAQAAELQWAKEVSKDLFIPAVGVDGKTGMIQATPQQVIEARASQSGATWSAMLVKGSGDYAQQQIKSYDAVDAHNNKLGIKSATPKIQSADAELQHQVNVLAIEASKLTPSSMSPVELTSSMSAFKNKTEQVFQNNIEKLTAAQLSATTEAERSAYKAEILKVEERKRTFIADIATKEGSYIKFAEFLSNKDKAGAEEMKTRLDYFSTILNMGFADGERDLLKSQTGRQAILNNKAMPEDHPHKQMARAMQSSVEAAISGQPAMVEAAKREQDRLHAIGTKANAIIRHLNSPEQNAAADALLSANGAEAEQTKQAVQTINSSATQTLTEATKAFTEGQKKMDTSDKDVNTLVANSQVFADSSKELGAMVAAYKTGTIDATLSVRKEEFNKNVATRAITWLMSDGDSYYASRTNATLMGNKLMLDSNGNIVLKNASKGDFSVQVMLSDTLKRVNMLTELHSTASGADRKVLAQQFVDKTNALPAYDRSMAAQNARANAEIPRDIGKLLYKIPGYAQLDQATRTIVDEAIKGFPTSKKNAEGRDNNFLNLREVGKDEFRSFPTKVTAVNQYSSQIDRYIAGKTDGVKRTSVEQIVSLWNNEKEAGSMSTKGYLEIIKKKAGLSPNDQITSAEDKAKLMYGMQFAEGGGGQKMSLEDIKKALN